MKNQTLAKAKSVFPLDVTQCSACGACAVQCPVNAISIGENKNGFRMPILSGSCVNCGLCIKICPWRTPIEVAPFEKEVYAANNKDDAILIASTSGGIFSPLAEWTIRQEGVVFGARYDEAFNVIHDFAEDMGGVSKFRRSKYVESNLRDSYTQVENFLKVNRKVLFSGTPCQIAGLKRSLNISQENLYTVEVICHGVPSRILFQKYLAHLKKGYGSEIQDLFIRDKNGAQYKWGTEAFTVFFKNLKTYSKSWIRDPFWIFFNVHLASLRPSCNHCLFSSSERIADITLGDFWGIQNFHPDAVNLKGTSVIIINTPRGKKLFSAIENELTLTSSSYENTAAFNPRLRIKPTDDGKHEQFYADLAKLPFKTFIKKWGTPPRTSLTFFQKCYYKIIYEFKKRFFQH